MASSASDADVREALELFRSIPTYPKVTAKILECERRIDIILKIRAKQAEDRAQKEEEESRERVVCEPLLKRFESLRGKAEIDAEIDINREKLGGLVTQMGELRKNKTDYEGAVAESRKINDRIDEINALNAKLKVERSGLSIFAIKAKREIDAKLDGCVSERCGLESKLSALELKKHGYNSLEEIDAKIRDCEVEIKQYNGIIDKLLKEPNKEDVKSELLKYNYGKRMIEDLEKQKLEAFKNKILNVKVGGLIEFGKSNYGDVKSDEPLYWRVLENKGDSVFVVANSIFTKMSYSSRLAGGDWHNCSVRTWLDRVYETAFSEDEKQYIVKKRLGAAESYLYPLSAEQVRKFLPNMEDRKMGVDWWVRTVISSYTVDSVMYVNIMGRIITAGKNVNGYCGVLPAMQLKFK